MTDTAASKRTQEFFRGCLIGGATGDALGWPVEFMTYGRIKSKYGPSGINDLALNVSGVSEVTDDTQMTLFTAEGILRAQTRGCTKGICHPPVKDTMAELKTRPGHEECTRSLEQSLRLAGQSLELPEQSGRLSNRSAKPENSGLSGLSDYEARNSILTWSNGLAIRHRYTNKPEGMAIGIGELTSEETGFRVSFPVRKSGLRGSRRP